ncbi:hypothetical protein ACF09Y_26735 [Streptomyces massasporeus]|uniref:hypothetical protein n=1 Tax=Streptomyces massasporeus TaxID=67324 RepID=UPI0036FC24DE
MRSCTDPYGGYVWSLGGLELVRFTYDTGTKQLTDPTRFALPKQPGGAALGAMT